MTLGLIFAFFASWCLKDLLGGAPLPPLAGMAIAFVVFLLLALYSGVPLP